MRCTPFFGGVISSCSDDDEGGGQSTQPPSENTELITPDGTKLKLQSIGDYSFSYNTDGLPTKIVGQGNEEAFTVSYNPMVVKYNISDYGTEEYAYTVYFNDKGYISKLVGVSKCEHEDVYENFKHEAKFTYNTDGHLVAVTANYSFNGVENEEHYSGHGKHFGTITYNENKPAKAVWRSEGVDNGSTYGDTYTFTFHYDNNILNQLNQFTHSHKGMMFPEFGEIEPFFFLGYLGKPSALLPTSIDYVCSYDGEDSLEQTFYAEYTFGSDGRLLKETYNYSTYNYSYIEAGSSSDMQSPSRVINKSLSNPLKPLIGSKRLRHHGRHAHR